MSLRFPDRPTAASPTTPLSAPSKDPRRASQRIKNADRAREHAEREEERQKNALSSVTLSNEKAKALQAKPSQASNIESISKFDSFATILNRLLRDVQLLNYTRPHEDLRHSFSSIVKDYVTFKDIFPKGLNTIGKELLKNGLFHEMWGKVCKKGRHSSQFPYYYQLYYPHLATHHSNFESAFNESHSSIDLTEDSNTRLVLPLHRDHGKSREDPPLNTVGQRSLSKTMEEQEDVASGGRLRLIDRIQSNERRIKAEIVCFFLGIRQYVFPSDIEHYVKDVCEFYNKDGKTFLILETFSSKKGKEGQLISTSEPTSFYLAMYGYVSFAQLLRVKEQYQIEAFILFDELKDISKWLEEECLLSLTK